VITSLQTIADNKYLKLTADDKSNLAIKSIDWAGPRWYSKDDDGVYRIGVRPTYSRIHIARRENSK
jgi:hypothetical protein